MGLRAHPETIAYEPSLLLYPLLQIKALWCMQKPVFSGRAEAHLKWIKVENCSWGGYHILRTKKERERLTYQLSELNLKAFLMVLEYSRAYGIGSLRGIHRLQSNIYFWGIRLCIFQQDNAKHHNASIITACFLVEESECQIGPGLPTEQTFTNWKHDKETQYYWPDRILYWTRMGQRHSPKSPANGVLGSQMEMPQLWEILLPSNSKWAIFLKMEHLINRNIWQVFSVLLCKTPCGEF